MLTIAYLHSKKIVHRDIKLENVLMTSLDIDNFKAKVADFGFSKMFDNQNLNQMLGSPLYMAPEIIKKQVYDEKVDIWSTGVLLYILFCGKPPFVAQTKSQVFHKIKHEQPLFDSLEWDKVNKDAKNLIK